MYKLRYLPQAESDLISIGRFIAHESGSVEIALQFIDKLDAQCEKLATFSGKIGHLRPELRVGLRSFPFGNYVIFFVYEDEYLTVAAITEGHRDIYALFEDE